MLRRTLLGLALAAITAPCMAAPAPLPPGAFAVAGRTVTVTLPYRTADKLLWMGATRMSQLGPFMFKGMAVKPKAGPGGTDLAVFSYSASGPGEASLKFGLVPQGQMLIGPPTLVYKGVPAKTYEAKIAVK